jgi:hypothetical protein
LIQILDWCLNVYCDPSQTVDETCIQWSRLKDDLAHAEQVNFVCKEKRRYLRWMKTAIEYAQNSDGGCGVDPETVGKLCDWITPLCASPAQPRKL